MQSANAAGAPAPERWRSFRGGARPRQVLKFLPVMLSVGKTDLEAGFKMLISANPSRAHTGQATGEVLLRMTATTSNTT